MEIRKVLFVIYLSLTCALTQAQQKLRLMLPVGHTNRVHSASFSSDGKYIVTASLDRTACIWDASSGKTLHKLEEPKSGVLSVLFSPNGKYVMTVSYDGTARVWDASSGKVMHNLQEYTSHVTSALFSPDGKYVVTASLDSTARIWDASTGKLLHILKRHKRSVQSALFSSDGKYVVTASWDSTARIWEASTGKFLNKLEGHTDWVSSASFSPVGKYVVTASADKTARIWDASTGKLLHKLEGHTHIVESALFSPDGKYVVTASWDSTAHIWEASSGKKLHNLQGHTRSVSSASFSSDGKYVVTSSYDYTARIWEVSTGKNVHNLLGHTDAIYSASFSRDGKYFMSASYDSIACVWDASSGKLLHKLEGHTGIVESALFSPDGKYVVTASLDSTARIWDASTGKLLHKLERHIDRINSASFSPDGKYVAIASRDYTARIWEVSTGKLLHKLEGHLGEVISVLFSPDGKHVVTASDDITTRVWDVSSGKILHILEGHTWSVESASFSPDGKYVVTASYDSTARMWDASTGKTLHTLKGHTKSVASASFSPNGKYVVTVSYDSTARMWDASTGKLLYILKGHTGPVESVLFSPDGKYIVTASFSRRSLIYEIDRTNTVGIWDASVGKLLYIFKGVYETSLFSDSDKKKIIATRDDHKIILWDIVTGKQIYNRYGFENENWLIKLPNSPYYMCSKEASKMLHYVTPDLKVIGFDQLDPIYNRPDIVLDSIGKYFAGGPDLDLIKQYKDAWVKRMSRLGIDTTASNNKIEVPEAEIVNAENIEFNNSSGKLSFRLKASDSKHTLRRYNVFVNEVPVYGSGGVTISGNNKLFEKDVEIQLSEGDNKIQVSVMNDLGLESFRYPLYVQYQPVKPVVSNTYYIGIGVDSFTTSDFNLQYCVKDVNDLGSLLAKSGNTKTIILKNKDVTKENVLKLIELLKQTTEQDKVIISCSSHGLLDNNNNFYLAMHNVDFDSPEIKGLAYEDLLGLLDSIPARKKLLLLDACNSGENETAVNKKLSNQNNVASNTGTKGIKIDSDSSGVEKSSFESMLELFVNVNNQTGTTVISAAGGKQSAFEGDRVLVNGQPIKNGAFTYSIIEYLTQNAKDKNKLTVNQLKQYAEQRVSEITNGNQKPTSRQETMEVDWGF